MKPIYKILLLLFSIGAFAQPKPVSYTRLILTQNPLKVSATRVVVQDATSNEFGYILKDDLQFYNEYTNFAAFPVSGTVGKIYADKAANLIYRWTGSAYQLLSPFTTPTLNYVLGNGDTATNKKAIFNGSFPGEISINKYNDGAIRFEDITNDQATLLGGGLVSLGTYSGDINLALLQNKLSRNNFNISGYTYTFNLNFTQPASLTSTRTVDVDFQTVSGTVAYISDISSLNKIRTGVQFFTDFDNTATNITGFLANNSGAGATAVLSTSTIPNRVSNQQGFAQYQTGTTSGSYFFHQTNLTHGQFGFGGGAWVYETSLVVETLSDVTERFRFIAGFGIGNFAGTETDAVLFTYDEGGTTNGTSASPNWQVVTSSNNVRTVTNSGVPVVAGQWVKLRIEINAAASSIVFKINNTTVATHTTNIPTFSGGRFVNAKQGIVKSAGTTNRSVFCDYIGYENNLTTPR